MEIEFIVQNTVLIYKGNSQNNETKCAIKQNYVDKLLKKRISGIILHIVEILKKPAQH